MIVYTFLFINKFHLLTFASPMQNEPMPMLARFTIHNCRCTRDHNRHFKTPTSAVTRGPAEFLKVITRLARANIYSLICTICRVHFARRRNGKSAHHGTILRSLICTTGCAYKPPLLGGRSAIKLEKCKKI